MKKLAEETITEDMPLSMSLEIARAKLLARFGEPPPSNNRPEVRDKKDSR